MQSRLFPFKTRSNCLIHFIWLGLAMRMCASDWPQFLGPARNGACAGNDLSDSWPKEGPRVAWKRKIGQGFSGPAVSAGKLILFHRLDDKEIVECLDADKGTALWTFDCPTGYRDDFGMSAAIADPAMSTRTRLARDHWLTFLPGPGVRWTWSSPQVKDWRAGHALR